LIDEVPNIFTLIWLDEGNKILVGEEINNGLRVWDTTTGTLIQTFADANTGGNAVWSWDDQTLAVIPAIDVLLLNAETFEAVGYLSLVSDFEQDYQPWQLDWSPINNHLAVGYMNGRVRIWDTEKLSILEELQANESPVERPDMQSPVLSGLKTVAYNIDGTHLYAVSADGTIRGWQVRNGDTIFDAQFQTIIYEAVWNPDRSMLAIGTRPTVDTATNSSPNKLVTSDLRDGSLHIVYYDDLASHIA
jgi:WD40 repeat protein